MTQKFQTENITLLLTSTGIDLFSKQEVVETSLSSYSISFIFRKKYSTFMPSHNLPFTESFQHISLSSFLPGPA